MVRDENNVSRRRLASAYVAMVASISLLLFLVGMAGLLFLNAQKIAAYVKENIGFSVIIKEDVRQADIFRLQKLLDARPYVKSTRYITKEQAAADLKKELGEDFIGFLGYNPLLASIDVRLFADYANTESIAQFEKEMQAFPQVKEIYYQRSLVHLVNENVRKLSIIILLFGVLMFLIAVTLINNTIRLAVYSKRFIINTMLIVGATRSYIRRPFLNQSILHGLIAGAVATTLVALLSYFIQIEIGDLMSLNDPLIIGLLIAFIFFIGIFISMFSTFFAVNKFLNIKVDHLYY